MNPCRSQAVPTCQRGGRPILAIGPPASGLGGMATVAGQLLRLEWPPRYRIAPFETTHAPHGQESLSGKVRRHLRRLGQLRRTLRRDPPAVVHVHTCSGFSFYRSAFDLRLARRAGCPTVLHIHGGFFDDFHAAARRPGRWFVRRTLIGADRVIALSAGWRDRLQALASGAHIVVVENAVDVPAEMVVRPFGADCRFLMLGAMDTAKGVLDLLAACRELRDRGSHVDVVLAGPAGSAGDHSALTARVRDLGLAECVQCLGPIRGEAKERLLRRADVFVLPSYREGMPVSILEAFAHGLPVIATRVGSIDEIIEQGEQGLLVSPGAPQDLAAAMKWIADDADARRAMGWSAYRLACERFSLPRLRDDLVRLYDDMLDGAATTAVRRRPASIAGHSGGLA